MRVLSNACSFCQSKESASGGKWFVGVDSVGRRKPLIAACNSCVDNGYDSSLGTWSPGASAPFRSNICSAIDATKYREAAVDEYTNRCDPLSVCKDIFAACPRMVELPRAAPSELRSALLRVKQHLAPASTPGLEDASGQGSEVLSDGTSLLLTAAQCSGSGTQAGKVAMDSVDRMHMKYSRALLGFVVKYSRALPWSPLIGS